MAFVEPPEPSGRSIYERLGLHPSNPRRVVRRMPRPLRPDRWKYGFGVVLLIAIAILWYALGNVGSGSHPAYAAASDADQRRMDAQQAQIQALDRKVEMLETKVQALQKVSGNEPLNDRRLPAMRDPVAPMPDGDTGKP
jgi:cell division protein FtsB